MLAAFRGKSAEQAARRFLESKGLIYVANNVRLADGELDLVMTDGQHLVFVEVRFRKRDGLVSPSESIDPRKQRRLINAATAYLQKHRQWQHHFSRFDILSMTQNSEGYEYQWLKNALST
ncbi:YraN family protein [Pokkaliibacter sp. CJK22405]|uniref:YraN family protein n=1 Tax=Pokkaliibacter sp. CJK22405 TaxID=3384615 RepID=UPI003984DF6F